ncbi:MAG TPA: glycosyltransferase family 4 protein [Polyangia bacterium]|nr:glycosyltransferase family 4 protein [Polyangia bacterium]
MRVIYLNPFSQEVSGPDESLRALLADLIPRGLEAHVVLPAPGPQVSRYEALGAQVHFAPLAILRRDVSIATAVYPGRLARSVWALRKLARRLGADLIHTNMEVVLDGGLAARALGLPHVLHYRGNTMDRPKPVFDALTAVWTRTADRIFCISNATAEIFRRRGYDERIEVLYNPIDLSRFRPGAASTELRAALGAGPDDLLIGTVGRIHPRKDLETFIRAAAQVSQSVRRARFVIVGAAEAAVEVAYAARLESLVREVGLTGKLMFAGARRNVPDVMRALDLFVLTSRHEGFGRVIAEAMATARPIVASNEGAPPELLERGRFGLCAAPQDAEDFARQILDLLAVPERAVAMGTAAAAAAGQFEASHIGGRVWERYQSLTSFRRSDAPTAPAP